MVVARRGHLSLCPVDEVGAGVVVEVLSHAGQCVEDLHLGSPQVLLRADTGAQQQVCGADGPRGEDHFGRRHGVRRAVGAVLDARAPRAVEVQPVRDRVRDDM